MNDDLAPPSTAPQHAAGPRPLPLFLELVRRAGQDDPDLAARALKGLKVYQHAQRHAAQHDRSMTEVSGGAALRDCGGSGEAIVLIPSLINPPHILDLDPATSLADALKGIGRVLLLDWGAASDRRELSVTGHVQELLIPLLGRLDRPATLVGYCLGGTMALPAASATRVRAVATLASPWRFSAYPTDARRSLSSIWESSRSTAEQLGVLPMEVLQAAFWSLDPQRVVAKFSRLADLDAQSDEFRRFILLESPCH